MASMILKTEERTTVTLEEKTLLICPNCSTHYGKWELADECDLCKKEFENEEQVICSEGRHFCKECFSKMDKDGLVEMKE